jgi:predicted nucleic acid-binding protein
VNQFVVDASVVLAWCFPDENAALAQRVASMFKQGDTAIAPSFWPHEVLNALLVGEKRRRISGALTRSFLNDLAALPIQLEQFPATTVFTRIQSLRREHSLTAYDAAYLDLSLDSGLPLATLDEDLIRACRKAGAELVQSNV